jgi:adenylate cyclase class 2
MRYIEIEHKYHLNDPQSLITALKARRAIEGNTTRQRDSYLNAPHRDFLAPETISEWLRIREEDSTASINYKRWLPVDARVKTHCDEYESPVVDAEAVRRTLRALDFTDLVTIEKHRQEWHVGDEFVIAIDTITDLGTFVEFEYQGEADDVETAIGRLTAFVNSLQLELGERINRGYPHMMLGREH